ncbi:MAG: cellulase family glycosylhydrolase [Solirubrobacterales bacterium]|nr:cellulase family glycosylhydrolase [Solirubrobacterales bacterium]
MDSMTLSFRPRRRLLAACVALATVLVLVPAAAQAAQPGINVAGNDPGQIAKALATNAKLVRFFVEWRTLQPSKGDSYPSKDAGAANLATQIDNAIRQVNAAGAKPIFVIVGAPAWANGSPVDQNVPPTDPQDYADFFAQFVRHTRDAGSVAAYEVWNEQDAELFWHAPSPEQAGPYSQLLKATYKTAKPLAGDSAILVGPLTGNNADYLQQLYDSGAKGSFDGVAVHTDTACLELGPDAFYRESDHNDRVGRYAFLGYRSVRQVMLANSDGEKGIWMTELGWTSTGGKASTCSRIPNSGTRSDGVTVENQAKFLTHAYGCMAEDPYLVAGFWFTMFDDPGQSANELRHYGLVAADGSHKPSYDAFTKVVADGGKTTAPCGDFAAPTVRIISPTPDFGYTGRLLIQASATDTAPAGVTPSGLLRLTFRVDGNPQAIGNFAAKDGVVVKQDYFGASKLADGAHTITVQARDVNGNVGSASVKVCKGVTCIKTAYTTKITLPTGKNPKCKGLTCTFSGRLTGPAGVSLSGRVRVEWQLYVKQQVKSLVKGKKRYVYKWTTFHKGGSNAAKPFAFKQKLKRKGKWRVRATYAGAPPLRKTATGFKSFTV